MKNFNYKKHYGQNFLQDKSVLSRISTAINPQKEDLIIEIGPGSGNLTRQLQKYNCQMLAYEIDHETHIYLDELINTQTSIIYDDFLKRDINSDLSKFEYNNLYIVGNLPYYITTPIIEKIIKANIKPHHMLFMVQKEVAERLAASPGSKNYGYITVYLNYYYKVNKLFNVSSQAFIPAPNVESAVIELINHQQYKVNNEEEFVKLIKSAFMHKRKTLNNNLIGYDKKIVAQVLAKHGFSLNNRAEEIPINVFLAIVSEI